MQKMHLHVEREGGNEMERPEEYAHYKPDYPPQS